MRRNSFRSIAEFMNSVLPANSLRELWNQHRHLRRNIPVSMKELMDRHEGQDIRFLSYNTWLLHAPFGNDKPAIPYRAYLQGQEIKKTGYDLAALTEVFERDDAYQIKRQSGLPNAAIGEDGNWIESGSGLFTLSRYHIVRTKRIEFDEEGGIGTMDSFAEKGVLYTEIKTNAGNIDLYSTHLIYGTSTVGEISPSFDSDQSESFRNRIRLEQVRELKHFVEETHKPENVAIITGDFNINAEESDGRTETYERMMRIFSHISLSDGKSTRFYDLWINKGGKKGATDQSWKKCRMRTSINPVYCNDFAMRDFNQDEIPSEGRIDYIFIEEPRDSHTFKLDTTIIRRRPFPVPELELNQIIDLLEVAADDDFKTEIQKRMDSDVDNLFRFSESRRHALLTISRHLDLKQLFNNWLNRQCSMGGDDKTGHLSDHIGLDVTLILSK